MKKNNFWQVLIVLTVSLTGITSCNKTDESFYLPEEQDTAIMFVHKFKQEDFEAGKQIVIEKFSKAIEISGQSRRTYFLALPDSSEVVAISFFHKNSSPNDWLSSEQREEVLGLLQPLYEEPLSVHEFKAERIHDSHSLDEYYPEQGDEVIIFTHLFNAADYETGKDIVVNGFSQVIENSGQTRRSYFLDNPSNYEVVNTSFFHQNSGTDTWLNLEERNQVLASMVPLFRAPLLIKKYTVEEIHITK